MSDETPMQERLSSPTFDAIVAVWTARELQLEKYSREHDDTHTRGELAQAAHCYADASARLSRGIMGPADYLHKDWPFVARSWPGPETPLECAIRAGAFLIAEIERLQQKEAA